MGGLFQTSIRRCATRATISRPVHHRVAISNHRLVTLADGMVTFRWRDSAHHNNKRLMTLPITSSCADSCCTCCRLHSSASAISAGWRIAAAAHRSRSACSCWPNQGGFRPKLNLRKHLLSHHGPSGHVPNAADRWSSSNGSAPWSFAGALRPSPPGYSHDSIFLIIASAHLTTLSPQVCPRCWPRGCAPRKFTFRQPVETPMAIAFSRLLAFSTVSEIQNT